MIRWSRALEELNVENSLVSLVKFRYLIVEQDVRARCARLVRAVASAESRFRWCAK